MWRLVPLLICCGCGGEPPAMVLEISSPLTIPTETNELFVRVLHEGETLKQASNALGQAPRDQWPQTLPILTGDEPLSAVDIEIELRMSRPGISAEVVGLTSGRVEFPKEGTATAALEVPRKCIDTDGDDYGTGAGCIGPDCDDANANVPNPTACPTIVCTPGGTECGDQVCYQDECVPACGTIISCGGLHLTCKQPEGVCVCRDPCVEDNDCRFCWPSAEDCQVSVGLTCKSECCAA